VRRAKEHFEFAASLTTKKSESPGTPNARMASWRETQARVKAEMGLAPRSGGVDESIQADWRAAHESSICFAAESARADERKSSGHEARHARQRAKLKQASRS